MKNPFKFRRLTWLIIAAGAVVLISLGVFGYYRYWSKRIPSGTYLILSRSLFKHTSGDHGPEWCWAAAYRWRLGSKEEPQFIDSEMTPYDCLAYEVQDNKLYKSSGSKMHCLDLNGKNLGDCTKEYYGPEPSKPIAGLRFETFETQENHGPYDLTLRILDKDGRLLREKAIGSMSMDGVSPDGSKIYFGPGELTDGYNGPWLVYAYDWKNDVMTELKAFRDAAPYDSVVFDRDGRRALFIVSQKVPDPEGHGWAPGTPSSIHLLDLEIGTDTVLRDAAPNEPFLSVRFSPDEKHYLAGILGSYSLYDFTPNSPALDDFMSKVADWFDNTLVLNDSSLIVRDVKTKEDTVISKDFASFDYVGHVVVP
jgi:hypothetical protein